MGRIPLFRTLRGRLTLLAALATLPAFLFVVYVAAKERTAALQRAESEARYVASLASREHAHQLEGAARLLESLAALPWKDEENPLPRLSVLLPTILSGFPQIANLGVLDRDGALAFTSVASAGPVSMSDNPAFQQAIAGSEVAVGRYQMGQIVGRPVLIMARALRTAPSQELRYVLFAALELAWLDRLAEQATLPPDYALAIVDRDGTVLAQSLGTARRQVSIAGKRLEGFEAVKGRDRGMGRVSAPGDARRLAVVSRLEGEMDLWVMVGPPERAVYRMANAIFYRDLVVLALLSVLVVASALFATDLSVLRDLRLLARATRKFGAGELQARAPVPAPEGEIRDLAISFNAMAGALETRHREAVEVQERLRSLSHRLQNAREEEAARIAQELHDELGQELSVLKLELEAIRRGMRSESPRDDMQERLQALGERIDGAVQSVRRISSELRPGVLDRLGAVAGVEWLLSGFERRTSIRTTLTADPSLQSLDSERATAVFRIVQEALTNVARHADASRVGVILEEAGADLLLRIEDDGGGVDPAEKRRSPSLGLLGIEERARRLGGSLSIETAAGSGTKLLVRIPLSSQSPGEGDDEDSAGR